MDERAVELLELPAILERLAGLAASEPGRELAEALRPSPDPDEVASRQALTAEAIALVEQSLEPDLASVRDVRPAVALAARGSALDPAALRAIAVSIDRAVPARAALVAHEALPRLAALAEGIEPRLAGVGDALAKAVEEDGSDLRDGASP